MGRPIFNISSLMIMMIVIISCQLPIRAIAQKDKKIYYRLIPARSHQANADQINMIATTASFYIDKKLPNPSTVSFAPYVPMPVHTGLAIRSNLLFGQWRLMGDIRSLYYPQDTWGLYGTPESDTRITINYSYFRFYQTLLRKISPTLFIGAGYHLDAHVDMESHGDSSKIFDFTHYKYGTTTGEQSLSSGISANLLYDAQLTTGNYGNIVYRVNPTFIGNKTSWHSLYLDVRKYIPLSAANGSMIALWSFYWTVFNSPAPYLDLPSIGWDPYQQRSARGFPQNRFRGSSVLYGETEYRSPFFANDHLGFALFMNLNSIPEPTSHNFSYFHPAAGGGIRLKFSKLSTAKIAIDCAFSDGYAGIYLNLGDTF